MCDKAQVYMLYFKEKKNTVEIASIMNVSKQAISKILKQFPEYVAEKERRKQETKEREKQHRNEHNRRKRREKKEAEEKEKEQIRYFFFSNLCALDYVTTYTEERAAELFEKPISYIFGVLHEDKRYEAIEKERERATEGAMARLHEMELRASTKRRKISNKDVFMMAMSQYKYNPETNRYEWCSQYGRPINLKKWVKATQYPPLAEMELERVENEKWESATEKQVLGGTENAEDKRLHL